MHIRGSLISCCPHFLSSFTYHRAYENNLIAVILTTPEDIGTNQTVRFDDWREKEAAMYQQMEREHQLFMQKHKVEAAQRQPVPMQTTLNTSK